ncbi:MAG: 2Fe-2S iron-sulfur cluster-binding protein [Myxococcota bacterium]
MSTFKLNGKEIPFEPGDTVIRAAWRQGIEIPHYCWHPGLSVAANCRMCLVEIQSGRQVRMPILRWDEEKQDYVQDTKAKLQPACQFPAAEGLEVSSISDDVREAQAHVQEFLLLHHPVDCPICDQAGECKLQDYYYAHQNTFKRKRTEPVHKPKGVRFGETIVYDAERCIMCTRCIRVCDELVGDHVLDMRERSNKNEIVLAPGRELDHKYTLMTEHVCPVGALTSRDFRFVARVWFLKSQPSVCPGCATGCNMHADYDPRYNRVFRLRPRDNLDVNRFWMCDDGMMTYKRIHEGRVITGLLGRGEAQDVVPPEDAVEEAAAKLKDVDPAKIGFVLSAQHATEDNFVLAKLAGALGSDKLFMAALEGWEGDDILRDADNNPNRRGAETAAGGTLDRSLADLLDDVRSGAVQAVVALGWAAAQTAEELAPIAELSTVVSLTSNEGPLPAVASIVVPVASWAEMHGHFINRQGKSQRFRRVIAAPTDVEPAWKTAAILGEKLGTPLAYAKIQDVWKELFPESPGEGERSGAEARA